MASVPVRSNSVSTARDLIDKKFLDSGGDVPSAVSSRRIDNDKEKEKDNMIEYGNRVTRSVNRNNENDKIFDYTAPIYSSIKETGNYLSEPQALQLVIGKTMREELGEEVAVSFCKNLKCGQLVLVTGRLGKYAGIFFLAILHLYSVRCFNSCCMHSSIM